MGARFAKLKVSLADEEHLFKYIASQNVHDRKATIDRLWEEEDENKSNYFERKEAQHFFSRLYDYLTIKKGVTFDNDKDDLIKVWIDLFDTNDDGKISLYEFKENLELMIKHPKLNEFKQLVKEKNLSKVLEITKLSLRDLPSMDKSSETDAMVTISSEFVGTGKEKRRTSVIKNNNNPVWELAFVFFSANSLESVFYFKVWDSAKEPVGSFTVDVRKALNEKLNESSDEDKEKAIHLSFTGHIDLSPRALVIAEKEYKKPTYKVKFSYEQLLKIYEKEESSSKIEMNRFNRSFFKVAKMSVLEPVDAKDVSLPKSKTHIDKIHNITFTKNILIFRKEHASGRDFGIAGRAYCKFFITSKPEDKELVPWTHKDAKKFLDRDDIIQWIPKPADDWWKDFTSDETLTRFFFQGIGAARIAKCDGGFVADFDSLKNYKVKEGYAEPQGKMYFNPEGEVDHIEYKGMKYRPRNGDHEWEHLKFLFRSTALIAVTAVEHLCIGHLLWSNVVTTATHTQLSPTHPIRRLLHIHTYRTSYVNQVAHAVLIPKGGALQRVVCWPHDELVRLLDEAYVNYKYETFSKYLKRTGMKDVDPKLFPLAQDGLEFWDILNNYVINYFEVYYPTDEELCRDSEAVAFWDLLSDRFPDKVEFPKKLTLRNITEVLTQFIFYVSAIHTQVGNVGLYSRDPTFAAGCVGINQRIAFPQDYYTQLGITITTTGPMPTMLDNWSHLFEIQEAKNVWAKFHSELKGLSEKINQRNQNRRWRFDCYNPAKAHTSIAV